MAHGVMAMAMAVMAHGVMAVMAGVMVMAVVAGLMVMAHGVMAMVMVKIVKKLRHCHCPQWNLIRMDMMRTMTKNRLGCDFTAHSSEGS